MVFKKATRKIEYEGAIYYWYVRVKNNQHRVHIISGDKKVNLEYPFVDTEIPVTPQVIKNHLKEYYGKLCQPNSCLFYLRIQTYYGDHERVNWDDYIKVMDIQKDWGKNRTCQFISNNFI